MAQPIKIKNLTAQPKAQPLVSQSIPVEWYKNYIPPTPTIRPKSAESHKVPDLDLGPVENSELSTTSSNATVTTNTTNSSGSGITSDNTMMSRSLMSGMYAASLPVNRMRFNPSYAPIKSDETRKQKEQKEEDETEKDSSQEKVTVGSYTCFQVIGGRSAVPKAIATSAIAHPKFHYSHSETVTGGPLTKNSAQKQPAVKEEEEEEEATEEQQDEQFAMETDDEENENEEESD